METACGYLDDKKMWISSDERKIINRVTALSEQYPDEMTILKRPEENDGCIYAQCPANWLKISPKKRVELSDEERAVRSERLKMARESTKNQGE